MIQMGGQVTQSLANVSCIRTCFLIASMIERTLKLTYHLSSPAVLSCDLEEIISPQNENVIRFMGAITLGSVVTFTCAHGFTLMGNKERVCGVDGWSGSNPTCVPFQGKEDLST